MYNVNKEIALEILKKLPENKKAVLEKALYRNFLLTSSYNLEFCDVTVYKEGWYLQFLGARCNFSVFAFDNDGEYIIADRKPAENKLHKLYSDYDVRFAESDFR